MSLHTLAQALTKELGPAYHLRPDYDFVIPSTEGVSIGRADAAIFSSAVPSIHTAAIGFNSANGNGVLGIDQFAYLGAPLLVHESEGSLSLYKFSGASAEKIDEQQSPAWVRDRVLRDMESPQLRLPLAVRDLLIQDTRKALESGIAALMASAREDKDLDESDAFLVAVGAMRRVFLPHLDGTLPQHLSHLNRYVATLSRQVTGRISFANVPAESIAELYETFAVTKEDRQRHGVVYTPAWLARYVVDRLPSEAFAAGRALDATCGSGTFLVCFLERVVERAVKESKPLSAELLRRSVVGLDIDPVAIEAARLSLDMFVGAIGNLPSVAWDLLVEDATIAKLPDSEWLVGNLPFGYRTHQGRLDISSVILAHIHNASPYLRAMSLILPDSLAYSVSAKEARQVLRTHYDIQEITKLPERVFASSTAATMALTARKGTPSKSILVREVRERDLPSLRAGINIARSFYADFPSSHSDPWRFSPFSNEFARAAARGRPLADVAVLRVGLQVYGMTTSPLGKPSAKPKHPLLMEPITFASWTPTSITLLQPLTAQRGDVRRSGPWTSFGKPKVILRATTSPGTNDRLAAIPDTQGVWFTDKFIGIWPKTGRIGITGLAAYFQTRFVRAWFATNNPSRKLRVRVLALLPIPLLPAASWERATALVRTDHVIRPRREESDGVLPFSGEQEKEWEWLNAAVDAALGLDPVSSSRLAEWRTDGDGDTSVKSKSAQPNDRPSA